MSRETAELSDAIRRLVRRGRLPAARAVPNAPATPGDIDAAAHGERAPVEGSPTERMSDAIRLLSGRLR
jgi:hypothetical protein